MICVSDNNFNGCYDGTFKTCKWKAESLVFKLAVMVVD